jgi:hypothetical protein
MKFSLEPNNCLRSSLRNVLKNKVLSDVQIILNGSKVFDLHRSVLSARSDKFSYFFDYFENKNDSETFSDKLKPILKKTTSVFEEKKYFTDLRETNESLFLQEQKPKSLKTIGWRVDVKEISPSPPPLKQRSDINLDPNSESDSEGLDDLDLEFDESKESSSHEINIEKVIENQNGFLKLKFWKPSEKSKKNALDN